MSKSNTGTSKEPQQSSPKDEDFVYSYLKQMGNLPRLATEEEIYHSNYFFNKRSELGVLLSRFPLQVVQQIQNCKVVEILDSSEDPEEQSTNIEEKKAQILTLVNGIKSIADQLAKTVDDASAKETRDKLYKSLAKLLSRYNFHSRYYQEIIEKLQKIKDETEPSAILLIPTEEIDSVLTETFETYDEMESSRSTLIESNLRLVISIARKYSNCGMNIQDLFQEGFMGLAVAVDKFQPKLGHRLSTYAVWWIRQAITQALSSHSRTIRIPTNMARALNKINRMEQSLLQELGREPTDEEIAEGVELPVQRVRAWRKMERQPISLESPIGDGNNSMIGDIIEDVNAHSPAETMSSKLLSETIVEVLDLLKDREREIIIHRFGLMDKQQMTLEELSKRFNVTHERIRQIEVVTLKKLRHPRFRKYFEGYY